MHMRCDATTHMNLLIDTLCFTGELTGVPNTFVPCSKQTYTEIYRPTKYTALIPCTGNKPGLLWYRTTQ